MKKPKEKDKFDEAVLRREDLKIPESELDEVWIPNYISLEWRGECNPNSHKTSGKSWRINTKKCSLLQTN